MDAVEPPNFEPIWALKQLIKFLLTIITFYYNQLQCDHEDFVINMIVSFYVLLEIPNSLGW